MTFVFGLKYFIFDFKIDDPDFKTLRESSAFTSGLYNVFNSFNVQEYLHAFGLGVKKSFRGRQIAVEILKAREKLMKDLKIKVTFTTFSTINSQKAACKSGIFKEVSTISYESLQKVFPDFNFSSAMGQDCKSYVYVSDICN